MPYKSEKIKIAGTKYDKRRKLTNEDRRALIADKGKLSQRAAARKYGVSRSTVRFYWMPEKLERARELHKQRQAEGRYYDREKHTRQIRKHRRRKQRLYKEGKIDFEKEDK